MRKLNFIGDLASIQDGLAHLSQTYGFTLDEGGLRVLVTQAPGDICVTSSGDGVAIRFDKKIHFFKALGLLLCQLRGGTLENVVAKPQFDTIGVMVDVSRNAVLHVGGVKQLVENMALMGLGLFMLYTEDTYEVPERPYFGYMRGRYTFEELRECDQYADLFGIEMVPCIQTLGHLATALRWDWANELRDVKDILMISDEKTDALIEEMIRAASRPFKSRRIHIGLDEAFGVGLGNYLKKYGYKKAFSLMTEHTKKVLEITNKYGLKPMMWSDMYFRAESKTGSYYDLDVQFSDDMIRAIPQNVQSVYWDYYHDDQNFYIAMIKKHFELFGSCVFAGGIWTWNDLCVNYDRTFSCTQAALTACRETGVREVFTALWGDDGAETNVFTALLGLQFLSEQCYAEVFDFDRMKRQFELLTGESADAFLTLSALSKPAGAPAPGSSPNPAKYFLWQDPLMGLFDKQAEGADTGAYYARLSNTLCQYEASPSYPGIFRYYTQLARVLSLKSELGVHLTNAYRRGDRDALAACLETLSQLAEMTDTLRILHMEQWLAYNKPFGFEVLDLRYGGLIARLKTAQLRVGQYLDGVLPRIEELEVERLPFSVRNHDLNSLRCNRYCQMVTAGSLTHLL